jgi:menaquinone-9 beta-reductase
MTTETTEHEPVAESSAERGDEAGFEIDVLVVGARVAGSILAALLGSEGWRVLAIDRASFPSPTLSTHFFRGSGCGAMLGRLELLDAVLALGAPPLVREYNADAITGKVTVDPPQDPGEVGFSLSVRRETLDAMLVERARREPTVEILEGANLGRLSWNDGRVTGAVIETTDHELEVRARFVVGADGHASKVARSVGAGVQEMFPPCRAMYYRYAKGFAPPEGEPDAPEFSLGDDDLAYVFPSDGDLTCIAVSLNPADYRKARASPERAFLERLAMHPFLAPRVARATWSGRLWACGPRSTVVRAPSGAGWALVGDSSMYEDPWTGEGMDHAAAHAGFLAEAIDDVLSGRASQEDAMTRYHVRRDEHALADCMRQQRWRSTSIACGSDVLRHTLGVAVQVPPDQVEDSAFVFSMSMPF